MNVALVVPPYADTDLEMACKESIGVCYLAAALRLHEFEVEIIDADLFGYTSEQTAERIGSGNYDLIGFSVLEGTIESVEVIVALLEQNEEQGHLTLGGYFPTMMAEELLRELPRVDSVILGEAEYTLVQLADTLQNGQDWKNVAGVVSRSEKGVRSNPCTPEEDIDQLPFPARDLLPEVLRRGGVAGIVGSRGCFERCAFCCMNKFTKISGTTGWRGRDVKPICDELEELVEKWGVRSVSFYDGNFIGPGQRGRDRAYAIGEEIIRRNLDIHFAISTRANQVEEALFLHLKEAGLSEVFVGLESMTQRILDLYEKHTLVEDNVRAVETLESCKIFFRPGFILYEPHISLKEIRENITFLSSMVDMHYCNKFFFFKALRVYRGSSMEEKLQSEGILIRNKWHAVYDWRYPQVGEYISITGSICSQIVQYVQTIQSFESDLKRYFETLLGKWNIQVHQAALDLVEQGAVTEQSYLDLSINAADELKVIKQKMERYLERSPGRGSLAEA